jgi:DNA polymerase-1
MVMRDVFLGEFDEGSFEQEWKRKQMKTLIIDSNYLGYAAAYTMKDLSHDDVATGVLFGFMSRVLSMGHHFETNDFVFCWDSRKSKRKDKHSFYKVHRVKTDPAEIERKVIIGKQFKILRKTILPKIGFKNVFVQRGYESDDIIMKIVQKWKMKDPIVVTADEDLYQCLDYARVFLPNKKKMMTTYRFREEYGILPVSWARVKRIAGCSSDEVPGIVGVGEKTAIKFIKGALKKDSVAYKKITSEEGKNIIRRNHPLVTLPFQGTQTPERRKNEFSSSGLREVALKYGMESFLSGERQEEWRHFFKGGFE